MQPQKNILGCYNSTAAQYAAQFINELEHKHLDRLLLKAFADENAGKGAMIDLGCGPGQTTALLNAYGVKQLTGTDLSPQMVEKAKAYNPEIKFETADMLQLAYPDGSFASAVAFYAIVHFDDSGLAKAFAEISRVLKPGGEFLLSYHVGDGIVHLDTFLEQPVDIDFYMWQTDKVIAHAQTAGFVVIDSIERKPYAGVEYPSVRGYLWLSSLI